jgi:hypothetical protein
MTHHDERPGHASGHAPTTGDPGTPTIHEVPVGIQATGTRTETDSLGAVEVPADLLLRPGSAPAARPPLMRSLRDSRDSAIPVDRYALQLVFLASAPSA